MATVPARNKRTRSGARFGRRFLSIAVTAFVGVNLYLVLRGSVHAPPQLSDALTTGEGSHRYKQIETAADIALADQATTLAAGAGEQQQQQHEQQQQQEQQQQEGQAGGGGEQCHSEENAEYDAEKAIVWGEHNLKDSAAECCASCQAEAPRCNVWVYCGRPEGCFSGRKHKECWLKHTDHLDPAKPRGKRSPDHGWTSGAVYSPEERQAALDRAQAAQDQEQQYLDRLRADERLPMVFLDVAIKGQAVGRIEMVLFTDVSPRAAENFRQLCTGEAGAVPDEPGREGSGRPRHLKGAFFYRIIDQFIDQAGVETESVFGGQFKDDPGGLQLKHEHKGLLSMANMGHDTNTAHFSIMMGPAHHLDGDYTIFGQVVSGFDVVDAINALSRGKKDNTATAEDGAQIVDSGQLRKGTLEPDLALGLQ